MPALMWLFLSPFLSALAIGVMGRRAGNITRHAALCLSALPLGVLLCCAGEGWVGKEIEYPWIPLLGITLHLKMDALSIPFIYLTALILPIALLSAGRQMLAPVFYALALLLEGLLIGFFTAQNLVLFLIFWEAMLLPLYFMVAMQGSGEQRQAALKFIIYMAAGSVLMVAAVLALYVASANSGVATFDMDALASLIPLMPHTAGIGAVFFLAFAVKTPLFPLHAWLPDLYYRAATPSAMLLSALLSKAGIYGFFRIGWGLFPHLLRDWSLGLLGWAIVGVLYAGLAAWAQKDYKRLIAYSSLSHVNFILAGLFIGDLVAHEGALLQAFNHGITIAALFLVAGWLEERIGTTRMGSYSGLAAWMPRLCWLTLFFVISAVAVPGTNGFVGELMILLGLYRDYPGLAALLGGTIILSVMYMLRWMQKTYFEHPALFQPAWVDIKGRELAIALPLAILVLWIGIYPAPFLRTIASAAAINLHPSGWLNRDVQALQVSPEIASGSAIISLSSWEGAGSVQEGL